MMQPGRSDMRATWIRATLAGAGTLVFLLSVPAWWAWFGVILGAAMIAWESVDAR